ncbi:Isochorismatase hydrolase [Marasmius fiardii PR-910]|nr:Isochorismatase hydrolase [Marasmius fiardii PR-910]
MAANQTKSLLLLCDLQSSFGPHIHGYKHVVQGCNKFLKVAKLLSIPTVTTTQYTRALGPLDPDLKPSLDALASVDLLHGPTDKTVFSMCIPEVIQHVTNDIDRVVIVGIESHICILQTFRDLRLLFPTSPAPTSFASSSTQVSIESPPAHLPTVNRDRMKPLQLVVLADCVSSSNAFEVPIALQTMRSQLNVQVSTTESLSFDLIGSSTNPVFKEFSKIVKEEKEATKESGTFWAAGSRM